MYEMKAKGTKAYEAFERLNNAFNIDKALEGKMDLTDKMREKVVINSITLVIRIDDAIQIAEKYAEEMCKKQKDRAIKIFEVGCEDNPLVFSYEEDARGNYPERENQIYQDLKNAQLVIQSTK